ncbi:alpha-glucosidase [Flavobacterium selenitireducens]|uniref:alpha-glucosidase n=1 Tax=Flavobacterium selenitireducens TaxID=2722704 RepID=UPI00168A94BD|nr:alpha-glucosidase [Flavobacterium selenitireducens]MBD3581891.1 alpha-glucosidase [Flavobacterium selenitireducens]
MKNLIHFGLVLLIFSSLGAQEQHSGKPKMWWKETVFYQIYMPSYADSNGDGYGDFAGITSKLDYLQNLGIKGIWLTPFLKSPKIDNGYDVADYYEIDAVYGTRADFDRFLSEAHRRGIKVIMDMVLNHTSTDAKWFRESRKSKDNPYRDYYIWNDQPNNWESFFGGSAWEKDEATDQYYYHKFDVRMADLNWSNPKVVAEIQEILRFWLKAGVDGFRLDVINFLTTDGILSDNPIENGNQKHAFDIDQPGVKSAIRTIRQTVEEFPDKFLVGEVGSDKIEVLKQYQSKALLDVVFNFNFGSIPEFSAERIFAELQSMEANMSGYPTLFFGSHDMARLMDRLANGNAKRNRALAALLLTAKGVPFVYFGEEIAMRNIMAENISEIADIQGRTQYKLALDKGKTAAEALIIGNSHNRDKSRGPMQWNATRFAGFSSTKSWIKVHSDYQDTNVEKAIADKNSIFHDYKKLIALRNSTPVLQYGAYANLEFRDGLISFDREWNGKRASVLINFGKPRNITVPDNVDILYGISKLETDGVLIFVQTQK